jgi:hypothetical protein
MFSQVNSPNNASGQYHHYQNEVCGNIANDPTQPPQQIFGCGLRLAQGKKRMEFEFFRFGKIGRQADAQAGHRGTAGDAMDIEMFG